jgi:Spy/CpxP family protein refolding chaperone
MKNSTIKFLLLVSVILNIAILITVLYLHYNRSFPVPFVSGHRRSEFLIKELSLSPEQARLFEQKEEVFFKQINQKRKQLFLKRLELLNLTKSDKPDTKKIDQTIKDISSMQEDIQRTVIAHIIDIKSLLNKEQQKKFFNLLETIITQKEDGRGVPHGFHH